MAHGRARWRAALATALVPALLVAGCSDDDAGAPVATPTTTTEAPSPSPTRTLRPVVGERTTTVLPLGSRVLLGLGANPEPDQAAVDQVATAVGDWLDAHLDRLQRTGKGLLGEVAPDDLGSAEERRVVTSQLASPDNPVESARYIITVYEDGAPQYLTVRVEVAHPDESVSTAGLVFVVGEGGSPRLSLFGPDRPEEVAG